MKLDDVNGWHQPPYGYELRRVADKGAYLVLVYVRQETKGTDQIDIYLNDQGREVVRVSAFFPTPEPAPKRRKMSRRERFVAGFLFLLYGLKEMVKCLKN